MNITKIDRKTGRQRSEKDVEMRVEFCDRGTEGADGRQLP